MKRILSVIVLLLVVAVLVTPFFVGLHVEEDFQKRVDLANREFQTQLGAQSTIRVIEYQRGWLRSLAKVETTIRLEVPDKPPRTLVFTESAVVEHGPFPGILGGDTRQGWARLHSDAKVAELIAAFSALADDPAALDPVRKALVDYPPVQLEIYLAFDGTSNWSLRAEPYQVLSTECCSRVSWGPLLMQGQTGADLTTNRGALTLERLEVTGRDNDRRVVLAGLGADFALERHISGLDLGKAQWSLQELLFHSAQDQLKLTGLSIAAESTASGESLDSRITTHLDSAAGHGADGARHQLSGDWGLALNGLDLATTADFLKAAQGLRGTEPDPAAAVELLLRLTALAEQSLRHDPNLSIAPLSLTWDGQRATGELELGLTGLTGADLASLAAHPEDIVKYARGQLRLSVAEALVVSAVETYQRYEMEQASREREPPADTGSRPGDRESVAEAGPSPAQPGAHDANVQDPEATTEEQQTPPPTLEPEQAQAMARQAGANLIAGLVEQGLMRREGADLVSEVKLEPGGKLTVNGKPMELPPLRQ